jgi:hypothetical protein
MLLVVLAAGEELLVLKQLEKDVLLVVIMVL